MNEDNNHSKSNFFKSIFSRKPIETVRETIEDLIEEASAEGDEQFSQHEQLLLNNVLCIKDKKCGCAMVPRAEILAFPKTGSIADLAELMTSKGHSRIPIYGESLDDIIGIVHVIDLVKCLLSDSKDTLVEEIVSREVKFIPPTMCILDLLRDMQQNKVHMAVVIDEYGGVDGLVTIEDLLEEIVGDIEDEYDFDEHPVVIEQNEDGITADARAELDVIEEVTGLDLFKGLHHKELEIDTLGGLVFHIAKRIPAEGEIINGYNGIKFKILDVDPRRIKKVMIITPDCPSNAFHK